MKGTVFYGMHMEPGVVQYIDKNSGESYRVLVKEEAIKKMDRSFEGCPVFLEHRPDVPKTLAELKNEADGFVLESFYLECDGKHWAKFILFSDQSIQAVRNNYKLSNAYFIQNSVSGGTWHNVDYVKEVTEGNYEHLALVKTPRYEGSVIMTPEAFKEYRERKTKDLQVLKNSKEEIIVKPKNTGDKTMLKIFKREKVENALELESTIVELPRSKREVSIARLVNEADEAEMKKENGEEEKEKYANGDSMVKVGDKEMSINNLIKEYNSLCDMKKQNEEDMKKKENMAEEEKKKENAEEEMKKKENMDDDKKKENSVEKVMNAGFEGFDSGSLFVSTSTDKIALGKTRYGS